MMSYDNRCVFFDEILCLPIGTTDKRKQLDILDKKDKYVTYSKYKDLKKYYDTNNQLLMDFNPEINTSAHENLYGHFHTSIR